MVSERIYGIQVSDIDGLVDNGTNMKLLAERGVSVFFTQVFRDSFFHADMHPGNVFVSYENPDNPLWIGPYPQRVIWIFIRNKNISRVHIGVKKTVAKHLSKEDTHPSLSE